MKKLSLLIAFFALALGATAALAHHGWSSYDADKTLTIEAPLKEVAYRNPHAHVTIDYEGREWHVVLAPINRMESRGLPEADDAQVLAAMAAEPILIERPLVETAKGVRLCRPQEKVNEIL